MCCHWLGAMPAQHVKASERAQDKARAYILYQYQETAAKPIARMQNPSHLKNNETGHQTALALQE